MVMALRPKSISDSSIEISIEIQATVDRWKKCDLISGRSCFCRVCLLEYCLKIIGTDQ